MARHGDTLENRYASYSANEWLDPMKGASSFEGAFLVSATPPIRKPRGRGTGDGGGVLNVRSLSRRHRHLTHGDLGEALGNGLLRCRYSLGLEGMEGHTTLGSTANS